MKPQEFIQLMKKYGEEIAQIRQSAHALHAEVNQTYDNVLPYGHHLDMVADAVKEYGYAVCECEEDVVPLFFGAYYHDSIEDARLTYNNVKAIAGQWIYKIKVAKIVINAMTITTTTNAEPLLFIFFNLNLFFIIIYRPFLCHSFYYQFNVVPSIVMTGCAAGFKT